MASEQLQEDLEFAEREVLFNRKRVEIANWGLDMALQRLEKVQAKIAAENAGKDEEP